MHLLVKKKDFRDVQWFIMWPNKLPNLRFKIQVSRAMRREKKSKASPEQEKYKCSIQPFFISEI